MRLIGLAVVLTVGLTLAPIAAEAQPAGWVDSGHEWRSNIGLVEFPSSSSRRHRLT